MSIGIILYSIIIPVYIYTRVDSKRENSLKMPAAADVDVVGP
jgi:hypothetical protein